MSLHEELIGVGGTEPEGYVPRDELYGILANRRRRYVIHALKRGEGPLEIGPLARRMAAWERDKSIEAVTSDERKSAYTALQQRHLPRMAEAGLVEFDRRAGVVRRAHRLSSLDVYAEVVPGTDVPWSHYYLGLAGVLAVVVACGASGVTGLPSIAWGAFCVAALTVSAAVHAYATRENRLGERPSGGE